MLIHEKKDIPGPGTYTWVSLHARPRCAPRRGHFRGLFVCVTALGLLVCARVHGIPLTSTLFAASPTTRTSCPVDAWAKATRKQTSIGRFFAHPRLQGLGSTSCQARSLKRAAALFVRLEARRMQIGSACAPLSSPRHMTTMWTRAGDSWIHPGAGAVLCWAATVAQLVCRLLTLSLAPTTVTAIAATLQQTTRTLSARGKMRRRGARLCVRSLIAPLPTKLLLVRMSQTQCRQPLSRQNTATPHRISPTS